MKLDCDKARAIKLFLNFIGYRKWRHEVKSVVAVMKDGTRQDLGTAHFDGLAEEIDFCEEGQNETL